MRYTHQNPIVQTTGKNDGSEIWLRFGEVTLCMSTQQTIQLAKELQCVAMDTEAAWYRPEDESE